MRDYLEDVAYFVGLLVGRGEIAEGQESLGCCNRVSFCSSTIRRL
ncbi:MAG: hypothetical protein ACUVSC_09995 [Candidatus Fervidibacter sp.]